MSSYKSNSYSAWKTVDDLVSKPVLGSDSAASWQDFQKTQNEGNAGNGRKRGILGQGHAPQMPTKRADKLGTGFQSLAEERANEEKIRKESGEASVGAGYTMFKQKKQDDESKPLSETEPRIRPDHMIYFIPSAEFNGWKEDYIFTTRHRGTGYYWDGMDTLMKQMGTFNSSINQEADNVDEPKKKKKKKKKGKHEKKENKFDIPDSDPNNPYQQVENAIRRRNEVLLARAMGVSKATLQNLQMQQTLIGQSKEMPNPPTSQDSNALLAAAGWAQVTDPSTNKTYYYHTKTRETKWENPLENEQGALSKPVTKSDTTNKGNEGENKEVKLPEGWKSAKSSDGKEYYYNIQTKKTTWERPTAS